MFDTARVRLLTALLPLAALAAACSQRETPQTPARQVSASPGEVAAATVPVKFDDSVSAHADRARIRGSEGRRSGSSRSATSSALLQAMARRDLLQSTRYVKTGKVRLAYLNFPLSRIHKNAQAAAEAAMCAGVQGKFWELHETLFQTQPKWADLNRRLRCSTRSPAPAKVEPKGWSSCMSTHATAKLIQADRDRSTPGRSRVDAHVLHRRSCAGGRVSGGRLPCGDRPGARQGSRRRPDRVARRRMNPPLRVGYEGVALLARGLASVAPASSNKLLNTFASRRGVRADSRRSSARRAAPALDARAERRRGSAGTPRIRAVTRARDAVAARLHVLLSQRRAVRCRLNVDFRDFLAFDGTGDARAALARARPDRARLQQAGCVAHARA